MAVSGASELTRLPPVAEKEPFLGGITAFASAVGSVVLCSDELGLLNQYILNLNALDELSLLSATNPPPDYHMIAARVVAHGPHLQEFLQRANAQLVMVPSGNAADPMAVLHAFDTKQHAPSEVLHSQWDRRLGARPRREDNTGRSVLMVLRDQPLHDRGPRPVTAAVAGLAYTGLTHAQQQERLNDEQERVRAEHGAELIQLDIVPLLVLNAMRRLRRQPLLDTGTAVRLPSETYPFGRDTWGLRLRARGNQLVLGAGPVSEARPTLGIRRAIKLSEPCLPA